MLPPEPDTDTLVPVATPSPSAIVERPSKAGAESPPDISVLLVGGGRLEIRAKVDAAGIKKLKQILDKYEEIFELLGTPTRSSN